MIKGFRDFILRGNVVDLAVAVIVAGVFGAVVTSFTQDLLTPLIAAIFGQPDFSDLTFTINNSQFRYGSFINAVIAFLITASVLYWFVVMPMQQLLERRKKGEVPPPEPTEDILLLREIRDALRANTDGTTAPRRSP